MIQVASDIASCFVIRGTIKLPLLFAGRQIERKGQLIRFRQEYNALTMSKRSTGSGLFDLLSLRHKSFLLSLTRPDILAAVNILAQVTEKIYSGTHARAINKVFSHAQQFIGTGLSYPSTEKGPFHLIVY